MSEFKWMLNNLKEPSYMKQPCFLLNTYTKSISSTAIVGLFLLPWASLSASKAVIGSSPSPLWTEEKKPMELFIKIKS